MVIRLMNHESNHHEFSLVITSCTEVGTDDSVVEVIGVLCHLGEGGILTDPTTIDLFFVLITVNTVK